MSDESINLVLLIRKKEQEIRSYLDYLGKRQLNWFHSDDPVRTKNLEKIAGHLHSILNYLGPQDDKPCFTEQKTKTLCLLLEQMKDPHDISSSNAWEFADMLEIELIRLGDPVYIYTLLKAQQKADAVSHRWEKYFPGSDLDTLLKSYNCGEFGDCKHLLEARRFLEYLRQQQILEYRQDRAKTVLRGKYLAIMALILSGLVIGLGYFYLDTSRSAAHLSIIVNQPNAGLMPSDMERLVADTRAEYLANLLPLVLFAGAVGSVLSRAIKLGKQPLHAEAEDKTREPPLGIRKLISGWIVFLVQPIIGATAALVLFLIFYSGILQIGGVKEPGPEVFGLIGFLAGFSEAYFIGTLEKITGKSGTP